MTTLTTITGGTLIGTITEDMANEMVKAYNLSSGQTKCVWFGLPEIDQMITLLKTESLLGWGTDGVRIYFATYTPDTVDPSTPNYNGLNTVVLVSTKATVDPTSGNTYHLDYFDHLQSAPAAGAMIEGADVQNRGELCQPNCDGVTLPSS